MAAKKVETKKVEAPVMVKVVYPHMKDGWFCFETYELPLDMLKQYQVTKKIEPDIIDSFQHQLMREMKDIFGI